MFSENCISVKNLSLAYLNSKKVFRNTFACILFINLCVVAAAQLINASYFGETERHLFVQALDYLGITPLTQKQVKNSKKFAIMDHILLEGHNATCNNFSILISKNNQFKLHLKESLLIKREKPEVNGNFYTHPFRAFCIMILVIVMFILVLLW